MIRFFTQSIIKYRTYFDQSSMFIAIRHAFTLMIPFMLIGSFATLYKSLPIKWYQDFMLSTFGTQWTYFFELVHSATFGILSLITIIVVSNLYISDVAFTTKTSANPLIGSILSLSCYIALLGIPFDISQFGVTGLFFALLVTVVSSMLYVKLVAIRGLNLSSYADGANPVFAISLHSILPASIVLFPFAVVGAIFNKVGVHTLSLIFNDVLLNVFTNLGDTLLGGLVFTCLVHIFWFFGIHGNNMLAYVSENLYSPAILENQLLHTNNVNASHILTKPFFDTFVLMGGSGATLCLLIAIFIWSRYINIKRHGRMSLIPSIFNINELILFGLPIVLEPLFLIPFILVPMVFTATTFAAMSLGLVPYTQHVIEWTTPIFLSGFLVTHSLSGSLLQLFNLCLGIMIYKPFLRLSEDLAIKRDQINYTKLVANFMDNALMGHTQCLSMQQNDIGNTAKILISDLEIAIKNNQLSMYYQPQFDANSVVIGVESLLRWSHIRYGFIYPPLILALAEEGGIGDALGHWIIDAVLEDTHRLDEMGHSDLTNSINLSAKQLEVPCLVDHILAQIRHYDLEISQISIEITENLALSGDPRIHDALTQFNVAGIKLSMDDFGMGHSSLMYLKSHHFHTIKLDGSLIKDIVHDKISQEIVTSIYHLSQSLSISLLAEFVETVEQRDKLFELGCKQYQGYLFSKALSFNELIVFLS